MRARNSNLLARVNFPLYSVIALTERHILVAGGGGAAKTGILNVIEIYELINNGSTCRAESVAHYQTGDEAVMNCCVHCTGKHFILFTGKEGNCQVYKVNHDIENIGNLLEKTKKENPSQVRLRKPVSKPDDQVPPSNQPPLQPAEADSNANILSRLCFKIQELEIFQTDFSDDPFQKLVKFSSPSNLLFTGGSDGHLRLWKYPSLEKIHDIEAHSDDVDDVDVSPLGKRVVTVSRDGHAKVWDVESGALVSELQYGLSLKSSARYIFRSCRFACVVGKDMSIIATMNPAVRTRPPSKCYIGKWNADNFSLRKIVSTGCDLLTVMTVSDNGCLLGLGTQEGGVKIYKTSNLQLIYHANQAHRIFVTGLQFLPTSEESRRITGGHEASLISISVDNHINIHHVPAQNSFGLKKQIIVLVMVLYFIFAMMDILNL